MSIRISLTNDEAQFLHNLLGFTAGKSPAYDIYYKLTRQLENQYGGYVDTWVEDCIYLHEDVKTGKDPYIRVDWGNNKE